MKPIPRIIYQSADEIEERIRLLEFDALHVPPNTNEHRKIMREIAMLRMHADAKRWLWGGPAKRQA